MYLFQGALALSPFRIQRLENQIQTLLPHVTSLDAKFIFLAWFKSPATREQLECLANLVGGTQINQLVADSSGASVFVTPRIGTLSPWSSKATEIGRNCGLSELASIADSLHIGLDVGPFLFFYKVIFVLLQEGLVLVFLHRLICSP